MNCTICGKAMKLLLVSYYCPNDCDKKPNAPFIMWRGHRYRYQIFPRNFILENAPEWALYYMTFRHEKFDPDLYEGMQNKIGYEIYDKEIFTDLRLAYDDLVFFGPE